jgi:hypothetical protein
MKEDIIKQYPSLCYTCSRARKVASERLEMEGHVGCIINCESDLKYDGQIDNPLKYILDSDLVAEGWVDLRAVPFGDGSGMLTNYQIITKKVRKCAKYQYNNN